MPSDSECWSNIGTWYSIGVLLLMKEKNGYAIMCIGALRWFILLLNCHSYTLSKYIEMKTPLVSTLMVQSILREIIWKYMLWLMRHNMKEKKDLQAREDLPNNYKCFISHDLVLKPFRIVENYPSNVFNYPTLSLVCIFWSPPF